MPSAGNTSSRRTAPGWVGILLITLFLGCHGPQKRAIQAILRFIRRTDVRRLDGPSSGAMTRGGNAALARDVHTTSTTIHAPLHGAHRLFAVIMLWNPNAKQT